MKVLVINAGSSSVKYQLFDMDNECVMAKGNCQKIGIPGTYINHKFNGQSVKIEKQLDNHDQAIAFVLDLLTSKEYGVIKSLYEISAVGQRFLHGGAIYTDSVLLPPYAMQTL